MSGRFVMLCVLLVTATMSLSARAAGAGAATVAGEIRGGLMIPVQDERGQIRTLFTSKEVKALPGGLMLCRGFRLTNREPAVIVEAAECVFSPDTYEVTSPGPIQLSSSQQGLEMSGEGFAWQHQAGRLVISNRVRTTALRWGTALQPGATSGDQAAPGTNVITADRFELAVRSGVATYRGHVQLSETAWRLSSQWLEAQFDLTTRSLRRLEAREKVGIELRYGEQLVQASSEEAGYVPSEQGGDLQLRGSPTWETAEAKGRGQLMTLSVTPDRPRFRVEGDAWLQLNAVLVGGTWGVGERARAALAPGGTAANSMTEVEARAYEYTNQRVEFEGPVRIKDQHGLMTAGSLEVFEGLGTNRVGRVKASGGVSVEMEGGVGLEGALKASCREAEMVVTNEPPTALLMGGVAWSRQGVQGTGDQARLVLKPEGAEVEVTGSATLQLPRPAGWGLGLESAKQPSGVQALGRAEAPVRIAAVGYALRPGSASFEGGVRVDMDPARVTCQRLEVALGPQGAMKSLECLGEVVIADPAKELRCDRVRAMAGADGKLEEIHGDGHVRVSVQSGDRRAFGTAAEAVYRALSNTLELTGEPRVQTADGMAVSGARVIAWELGTRRMRFVGPYQISGPGALLEAVRRELTNALPAGLRP